MKSPTVTDAIVVGGGIAGLTAAQALREQGRHFCLLERCPSLGGLTRTVEIGEFCFDYTGHFLHLSRYGTPADIPYAGLENKDWKTVDRRSCCFIGGKFVTAPIQYNLAEVPEPLRTECIHSYEQRPSMFAQNATFRDYVVAGFGERLADLFLIPQNEKTMATSLDRLSSAAVRRFFPAPDEAKIRNGMGSPTAVDLGYNARFWYPRQGGIDALVAGLSRGIQECVVHADVCKINLKSRTIIASDGKTYRWNVLFSSMPLKYLCSIAEERSCVNWPLSSPTVPPSVSTSAFAHPSSRNSTVFTGSMFRIAKCHSIAWGFTPTSVRAPAPLVIAPLMLKSV